MAKPGKKKKVLFVLEIIVLLLFIGGLYVYGQISSRLDKIEQPELKKEKIVADTYDFDSDSTPDPSGTEQ